MRDDPQAGSPQDPSPGAGARRAPPEKIGALLSRLVDDSERFVRAEVRLYRAQAIIRLIQARTAVIMAAVGAVLVLSSAIALQVGLILILLPHVGRVGAVAIVVVVSLLAAWILFRTAIATFRRITEVAPAREEEKPA